MTKTVANRSKPSAAMQASAAKGRALMGGTTAMRAARERYLPKFGQEQEAAYEARLRSSWLFNGYRKTVRDMTGRVFSKPVEINDAPTQIEDWAKNIDLQGRDLSTFARQVFEDAIEGPGISYIMVDAPPRDGTVTQAQAQARNLRPYMIHLRAEDILGWKTAVIANVTTLIQLRIMEEYTETDPKDEFAEVSHPQVRVLDLIGGRVQSRIFRKGERDEWLEMTDLTTILDVPQITVVPFYANRTGFFTGAPLLDDLADINIAHWQSQSDQRNILHYARVPILFGAGVAPEAIGIIGASTAVVSEAADATLQWVEHSGKAIEAGRQDLKDLEFQMETFGLQLLTTRPQAQSATGEMLDANKETSILAMTADQLQDAIEQALIWMAEYGGLGATNAAAVVNKDFGVTMMTAQEIGVLLNAVNTGNISRKTFLEEMARRGAIRSDIDIEAEFDRIDEEYVGETPPPDISAA